MSYLHVAALVLAGLGYLSLSVVIGCLVKVDDTGVGREAAVFALLCGLGAVVLWVI